MPCWNKLAYFHAGPTKICTSPGRLGPGLWLISASLSISVRHWWTTRIGIYHLLPDPWTTSSLKRRLTAELIRRSPLASGASGDFSYCQVYLCLYADDSKCMGHRGQSYFMRLIALSEKHRSASGISHMNVPFGIIESHWWPTVRLLSLLFAAPMLMTSERHFRDLTRSRLYSFWRPTVEWA